MGRWPDPGCGEPWWITGGVVVVVAILAVAAPFVYIHFIEGPAPAKLELPKSTGSATATTAGQRGSNAVAGVWNVGAGSVAGYRVDEVLIGQNSTAVGRTHEVWGSVTIDGTTVTTGRFSANMASVVSDQSERNARFDGSIMDVAQFPTATLTISSPIDLAPVPDPGTVAHYGATGALAMHGVTKPVSFTVTAERVGDEIDVLADITIPFSQWDIANPSIGGFVTTASKGTLEVLLHLTRGAGNPASNSTGALPAGGAGSPPTVPRTTVPPLRVPRR
jgi:polyisoprenoid-binding protein YceI